MMDHNVGKVRASAFQRQCLACVLGQTCTVLRSVVLVVVPVKYRAHPFTLLQSNEVADQLKANDLKLSMRIAEKEKELSLAKLMNRNKDELIAAKEAELAAAKAALLGSTGGTAHGDGAAAAEG